MAKKTKPAPAKAAPARKADSKAPVPAKSSDAGKEIDVAFVEALGEVLARLDLAEVEVERGDLRVRVSRYLATTQTVVSAASAPAPAHGVIAPPPQVMASPAAAPAAAAVESVADHPGAVKSPMVGTAYRRPSPTRRRSLRSAAR